MEQAALPRRVVETRRRHGEDFYARIGRMSQELRQRAQSGDAAALDALRRRRAARERRRDTWLGILEAREAVHLLQDELHSRVRANVDGGRATLGDNYAYTARLRDELRQAEGRLATFTALHEALLQDLHAVPEDFHVGLASG